MESESVRCSAISGFFSHVFLRFQDSMNFHFAYHEFLANLRVSTRGFLCYVFDAGNSELWGSPPMLYTIGSRGHLQMISKQAVNWARQFHPQELLE